MQNETNFHQHSPQELTAVRCEEMDSPSEKALQVLSKLGGLDESRIEEYDLIYQDLPLLGPFKYKNGDIYLGQYKDGERTGFGKQVYADGNVYEGYWKNDKREGYGRSVSQDGGIYRGEFNDDKPNGWGSYQYLTVEKYTGEWKEGKVHGLFVVLSFWTFLDNCITLSWLDFWGFDLAGGD